MKGYVWTYWTKPQRGGFSRADIACLSLSVALASIHGQIIGIHTDSEGARQINRHFIGADPIVSLDGLSNENPKKYALAKIYTYLGLDRQCVHIDHDVFLKKDQNYAASANFYAQCLEKKSAVYRLACEYFLSAVGRLPSEVKPFFDKKEFCGYNMGYLDIRNHGFLAHYAKRSIAMFGALNASTNNYLNVFCEQYLFYCMTRAEGISVETILGDSENDWDSIALQKGYTHLMSGKSYPETFGDLMTKLSVINPKCHEVLLNG